MGSIQFNLVTFNFIWLTQDQALVRLASHGVEAKVVHGLVTQIAHTHTHWEVDYRECFKISLRWTYLRGF